MPINRGHKIMNNNQAGISSERPTVKLKVCGMREAQNIKDVAALNPDYLGFIFYKESARYFSGTIPNLPKHIKKVGVFVNATVSDILNKVAKYGVDLVQLHGEESAEFCSELKNQLSEDVGIIKVFSVKNQFNFEDLTLYEPACDFFLFDTKGKLPGGNGYTFNWSVLKNYPSTTPYFLSGGIGLDELEKLEEFLSQPESRWCHAIDVNSKFEIEPGLKNIKLLKEFKNKKRPHRF